jgi:hypothetical protein
MLIGGCYCGSIRYEGTGEPSHFVNCHCSICRRTTGAPFVAWFSLNRQEFRFTKGIPTFFKSTQKGLRSFCSVCGTQLTFENSDEPDLIDITICSLDDPESLSPEDHIHVSSKLKWTNLNDNDPQHLETRPSK